MKKLVASLLLLILGLTGCARYHPAPLPESPSLLPRVPRLAATGELGRLPALASHRFDPDDGLDLTEVAMLAVANNPGLRAVRDERGIASSQLMAAGILPNPQLTGSLDHPFGAGPGYVNAFNAGLSYDIQSLVTRGASVASKQAALEKVDWSLLWEEWQVVQKARLLFIQSREQAKIRRQMEDYRDLLAERYRRGDRAMKEGNLTVEKTSADLGELQTVQGRLTDLERQQIRTRQDLDALLGLSPDVELNLTGEPAFWVPGRDAAKRLLDELPRRRPDLLALQAGYQSQEEEVRKAVLAQFPAFDLGVQRSRDTSAVNSYGFTVTLALPIFDRNQGAIAAATATRRKLFDEYQARLDDAYGQAWGALSRIELLERQYRVAEDALPSLATVSENAEHALAAGTIDYFTYTTLRTALFEKKIEALTLEQTILEQKAVLQTLLGNDFGGASGMQRIRMENGDNP